MNVVTTTSELFAIVWAEFLSRKTKKQYHYDQVKTKTGSVVYIVKEVCTN